ncbi:hypothetical protein IAI52_27845 [Pseudomonas lurida]|uniref:hypothetical protein n=1 Tax=Pseudomonas lurida TaxID=244566 RepID=UPI0016572A85|nr:hypothetical protein [Pseudomonas lurida]MBC8984064.1 hypothetical protein [Pseudomonas lurida]
MKRKPRPASVRTGQTLFYLVPPLISPDGLWFVAGIAVGSDKKHGAYPSNSVPRAFAAQVVGKHPGHHFYSRRQALTAARVKNETEARERRAMWALLESRGILQDVAGAIAGAVVEFIEGHSNAHVGRQEAAVEVAQ